MSRHSCQMWFSLSSLGIPRGSPSFLCSYGKTSSRQLSNGLPARRNPWTGDEYQKLKDLCQQGLTMHQIAAELNRSYSAVDQHIRVLKHEAATHTKEEKTLNRRDRWSVEEDALLLEKFKQGLTLNEITTFFPGRTFRAVSSHLPKVKAAVYAPQRNLFYTDEFIQRFIDLRLKEAKTFHEMAVDLNCSPAALTSLWSKRVRPILSKEELNAINLQTKWTPGEMKHLLELQHRETTIDDAALQFPSKSRRAVYTKIHRERLRFPGEPTRKRSIAAFRPAKPSAATEKDESKLQKQG